MASALHVLVIIMSSGCLHYINITAEQEVTVTPNLVPPKSCPAWALIEYKLYTVWGVRAQVGLGSVLINGGGQFMAGDLLQHYSATSNAYMQTYTYVNMHALRPYKETPSQ